MLPAEGDTDIKAKVAAAPRKYEGLGLPGWIQGYNGKPALITKSGSIYRGDDYIEIGMNTFRLAGDADEVHQLMPRFKDFDFHAALALEGVIMTRCPSARCSRADQGAQPARDCEHGDLGA